MGVLSWLLVLSLFNAAIALLYARYEYQRRGRLTWLGLLLLCLMLLVPNLLLEYATVYRMPSTPIASAGAILAISGLLLCLVSIGSFGSLPKVLCLHAGRLTTAGPYRWSRNPQYVGWLLFLLGFALTDWSLWCLAVLLIVAVSLHLLVLVEEEHLRRAFGEEYIQFCREVPRYLRFGPLRI